MAGKPAIMRPLDPSDPRSLAHPGQREAWLGLARRLGEALAVQEWQRQHGGSRERGNGEAGGDLRTVLE